MKLTFLLKSSFVILLSGCAVNNTYYQQQDGSPAKHRTGDLATPRQTDPVKPAEPVKPEKDDSVKKPSRPITGVRCAPFKMPPLPELPAVPLEAVTLIEKSTLSETEKNRAIDGIEKQHIIALRAYGKEIKEIVEKAQAAHQKTCRN